jgi:hypothetical protein
VDVEDAVDLGGRVFDVVVSVGTGLGSPVVRALTVAAVNADATSSSSDVVEVVVLDVRAMGTAPGPPSSDEVPLIVAVPSSENVETSTSAVAGIVSRRVWFSCVLI